VGRAAEVGRDPLVLYLSPTQNSIIGRTLTTKAVILLFQAIVSLYITVPEVMSHDNSAPGLLSFATVSQELFLFTSLSWTVLSPDNSVQACYEQTLSQDIKCIMNNSGLTFSCPVSLRITLELLCPRQLYPTTLSFLVVDNFVPGQLVNMYLVLDNSLPR
jgi:hypothetical protein